MLTLRLAVLVICAAAVAASCRARAAELDARCYGLADFAYRVGNLALAHGTTRAEVLEALRRSDLARDDRELRIRLAGFAFDSPGAPWEDAAIIYKACASGRLEQVLGARL
jgi:hypothetical protein